MFVLDSFRIPPTRDFQWEFDFAAGNFTIRRFLAFVLQQPRKLYNNISSPNTRKTATKVRATQEPVPHRRSARSRTRAVRRRPRKTARATAVPRRPIARALNRKSLSRRKAAKNATGGTETARRVPPCWISGARAARPSTSATTILRRIGSRRRSRFTHRKKSPVGKNRPPPRAVGKNGRRPLRASASG